MACSWDLTLYYHILNGQFADSNLQKLPQFLSQTETTGPCHLFRGCNDATNILSLSMANDVGKKYYPNQEQGFKWG